MEVVTFAGVRIEGVRTGRTSAGDMCLYLDGKNGRGQKVEIILHGTEAQLASWAQELEGGGRICHGYGDMSGRSIRLRAQNLEVM